MEAVLLSVSPAFIAEQEKKNPKLGVSLAKIKRNIQNPLAAILSLNTIAHTVGAAGAGAQATHVFGDEFVGLISAVLTILILVFSEIIPKTIGALYWRSLASICVSLIGPTMFFMWPLVRLSDMLTRILARGNKGHIISQSELLALAELGAEEGVVTDRETKVMKNLFRLRTITADKIMTPRTVVFARSENDSVQDVLDSDEELIFSRIPVYKEDMDNITGFVLKNEIYHTALKGGSKTTLAELKREIYAVPEWTTVFALFEELVKRGDHISLLIEEYGSTAGIVTLEDVIETLIGMEIVDETDPVRDMQKLAKERGRRRIEKSRK